MLLLKFYHCPRCNKDYHEHDPCAYGDRDCCPECGWQPGYKYCSECGSEMLEPIEGQDFYWCTKCGHEEPVEGEKPDYNPSPGSLGGDEPD